MNKLASDSIVALMVKQGLVPVFNHSDPSVSIKVIDTCYNAGIRVFEFTNREENALEVFEALVAHTARYPDIILGIGTILNQKDAKKFFAAGASFIVSPAMIPEIAQFCSAQNMLWVPGCGTATEMYQAIQLGAKMIKAFPGNILGSGFVKSMKAVFPNTPIMPTGGVSPSKENLKMWFEAGVACVGIGSQLMRPDLLINEKYQELENLIKDTLNIIASLRQ